MFEHLLIVCFRNIFQVYFMEIIVNFHLIHKCRGQQSRWLKLQLLWSSRKPIVCTYSFLMTTHIHPQVILGTRWGKYRNNNTCKFPIKPNPSSNNLSYQKTKSWKRSSFHFKLTISSFFVWYRSDGLNFPLPSSFKIHSNCNMCFCDDGHALDFKEY